MIYTADIHDLHGGFELVSIDMIVDPTEGKHPFPLTSSVSETPETGFLEAVELVEQAMSFGWRLHFVPVARNLCCH